MLGNFEPHADSKRLGFERYALLCQHFVDVAGAMAGRQHTAVGTELFAGNHCAAHSAVFNFEPVKPRAEAYFAAEFDNPVAQSRNQFFEYIAADMRFGVDQNIGRRAATDKRFEKAADARTVFAARSQLAVGKKPRATFAVEHIAFDIQRSVFPEGFDPFGARRGGFAAFNQKRLESGFRQTERGHQSGRTGADHENWRLPIAD